MKQQAEETNKMMKQMMEMFQKQANLSCTPSLFFLLYLLFFASEFFLLLNSFIASGINIIASELYKYIFLSLSRFIYLFLLSLILLFVDDKRGSR